jgi:hypothetical protein
VPLDADLSKRIERISAKIDRDIEELDRLIILAFIRGASLRDIADVTGMTHVGVKKRIDRVSNDIVMMDADGIVISVIEAKNSGRPNAVLSDLLRRPGDDAE